MFASEVAMFASEVAMFESEVATFESKVLIECCFGRFCNFCQALISPNPIINTLCHEKHASKNDSH